MENISPFWNNAASQMLGWANPFEIARQNAFRQQMAQQQQMQLRQLRDDEFAKRESFVKNALSAETPEGVRLVTLAYNGVLPPDVIQQGERAALDFQRKLQTQLAAEKIGKQRHDEWITGTQKGGTFPPALHLEQIPMATITPSGQFYLPPPRKPDYLILGHDQVAIDPYTGDQIAAAPPRPQQPTGLAGQVHWYMQTFNMPLEEAERRVAELNRQGYTTVTYNRTPFEQEVWRIYLDGRMERLLPVPGTSGATPIQPGDTRQPTFKNVPGMNGVQFRQVN